MVPAGSVPTVALLPWGLLFDEDYLDTIGVSLEAFCVDGAGGHLFNFITAMQRAGVNTVLVLFSRRVPHTTRFVNRSTNATVIVLPPPARYRVLRDLLARPDLRGALRRLGRPVRTVADELAAYLATPMRALARELRREGCRAIVCQEYEFVRFDVCVLLGRLMRLPVFATFQGGNQLTGELQRLVRPRTVRRASGLIIAPSTEIDRVRSAYGVRPDRIAQIFNALEPSAFDAPSRETAREALGIPADARVAVWHGRVEVATKGVDVLIDAWQTVCASRPREDLRLLMLGTGVDSAWMHERLANGALRGVSWRDEYVQDRALLRLHLAAGDVFAFPSRHEGFAVAPLEAMACGLPIVAADAPGIPDLLSGGEADGGIMVPRGDGAAFAAALGRVLDDVAWARATGARARQRVAEACALDSVGRRLRDFLFRDSPAPPPPVIDARDTMVTPS
ncbi:MAG: glycosyltransferase family 4 protein [Gemmatimonadaceae bacterium]